MASPYGQPQGQYGQQPQGQYPQGAPPPPIGFNGQPPQGQYGQQPPPPQGQYPQGALPPPIGYGGQPSGQYGQQPPQQYGQPPQGQYGQQPGQYPPPGQPGYGQPGDMGMGAMMGGMGQMMGGMAAAMGAMGGMGGGAANSILFASYGGADVTQAVRGRLQQQGALNWGPNQYHTWMGDPFPGQYKDFVVVSMDQSCQPNRMRVNLFEDHEPCQIVPGPGPSSVRREPPHAQQIVLANYGGRDVTQQVQQMFAQGGPQGLMFPQPPHMLFGDPMPGVVKCLVIIYLNQKMGRQSRDSAFWFDGETIVIPRG